MTALATFYRLLLLAYPRDFRREHGEDASRLFAEACADDWKHGGLRPMIRRILAAIAAVPLAGLAEHRERWQPSASWWRGLRGDVRQSVRSIRRRPAVALTIMFTLAVGLGTNVAIFSVIDATLLRPLPFTNARRVVVLETAEGAQRAGDPRPSWTRQWVAGVDAIERVEWRISRSALVTGSGATRARVIDVSGGYLDAIGARPVLGRSIGQADTRPGSPRIAVLSQRLWRQQFGGSIDVIGQSIAIDGEPHAIIGVVSDLEADVAGLTFRLATALHDDDDRLPARTVAWIRHSATLESAQAELDAAPPVDDKGRTLHPRLSLPVSTFWNVPQLRTTVLSFLGAAVLVLVIAGVNVAHLFLAAGQERRSEIAVRRALGASTLRVARLLFVETMTLVLAGAVIGLAVAWALIQWLASLGANPQLQTRLDTIRLDPVVVGYALGLACFVAVIFGLWPALRSVRQTSIAAESTSTRSSRRRQLSSSVLMAAETGLSAVLLIVAGIVGHAFVSMQMTPRGFDADRVLGVRVTLPGDRYPTSESRAAFFNRLGEDAAAIPGVEGFGIGYGATPPSDFTATGTLSIAGSTAAPIENTWIGYGFVTPGYFSLMGIPLLQGSDFAPGDMAAGRPADAAQTTVISRSMANRFWPNGGAVGAIFQTADKRGAKRFRVAGVAGDVSEWGLLAPACRNCDLRFYLPLPDQRMYTDVLLRLQPGATPPAGALRAAISSIDPDVPADDQLQTAEVKLAQFINMPRFTATLFTAFAGVAVLLVAIGLSAIVARAVAQRTREMGIRLALGATPSSVRSLVIKDGLRPALAGLAVGTASALVVTRAIRSLLYGLSPADPLTLLLAPLLLAAIVLAALALPALRATRVDPAKTLRAD